MTLFVVCRTLSNICIFTTEMSAAWRFVDTWYLRCVEDPVYVTVYGRCAVEVSTVLYLHVCTWSTNSDLIFIWNRHQITIFRLLLKVELKLMYSIKIVPSVFMYPKDALRAFCKDISHAFWFFVIKVNFSSVFTCILVLGLTNTYFSPRLSKLFGIMPAILYLQVCL